MRRYTGDKQKMKYEKLKLMLDFETRLKTYDKKGLKNPSHNHQNIKSSLTTGKRYLKQK